MKKYKAKRYVLEAIGEEQAVECEANSIQEAEELFELGDCDITSTQMGELENSGLAVNVEDIEEIEDEAKYLEEEAWSVITVG